MQVLGLRYAPYILGLNKTREKQEGAAQQGMYMSWKGSKLTRQLLRQQVEPVTSSCSLWPACVLCCRWAAARIELSQGRSTPALGGLVWTHRLCACYGG